MTIRTICEYDGQTDSWGIYCPELPGLTSCGETEQQAVENFREAAALFFTPDERAVPAEAKVLEMVI